ncbi:hypothetical protein ACTXT7_016501 [Hymenolepis weldensis]
MEGFLGSWKLSTSEGFDRIMERLGLDYITRKAGNVIKPVIKITEVTDRPGTYNLKTINTFRSTEVQFQLQEPFLETTVDGRKVKTIFTLEHGETEGDWVLRQCQVGDKVTDYERRLLDKNTMKTRFIKRFH